MQSWLRRPRSRRRKKRPPASGGEPGDLPERVRQRLTLRNRDLLLLTDRGRCLGQRHGQHAVLEQRRDVGLVDILRQLEAALEAAIAAFGEVIALLRVLLVAPGFL